MSRLSRFAPVSGAPSPLIAVASGYFMFSGVLIAAVTLIMLLFASRPAVATGWLSIALSLVAAAGMLWTGILLGRKSRRGGFLALGFVLLSLLSSLSSIDWFSAVFTVLSLIVLASIWRDLE